MKSFLNFGQKLLLLFVFTTFLFGLNSCSFRAEQKSLISHFDSIDSLIQQNLFDEAYKELRKVEKLCFDSWSYLGIYKRYLQLSKNGDAEKLIKKALSKNSENIELCAVYSKLLLDEGRIEEAINQAKILKGTKYGAIYSEAVLKNAAEQSKEVQNRFEFYDTDSFYDIYYDAYAGSRNPVWLKNCAVHNLRKGLFENAASLNPGFYSSADDAYFWSLVLYDSQLYYDAIDVINAGQKLLADYSYSRSRVSDIKFTALLSDCYMSVSDNESAEKARQKIIINLDNLHPVFSDEQLLPVIVLNSAIWAKNHYETEECSDLLFYAVARWPNYVPGLILYADFAYESNLEREEDQEMQALRKAGISSLEMEKYDNRRKIPLSDAFYRINNSLKEQKNPYLEITKLDLKYKMNRSLSDKDKIRDIWTLLEDNYTEDEKYQVLLVEYAVEYLIGRGKTEDAWTLFAKYIRETLTIDENRSFWEQFQEQMRYLDLTVAEFGGYFAEYFKLRDVSTRILEYCVYETGGNEEAMLVSPVVSNAACMNLADIYYSTGKKSKAMELYGKAAGREINNARRSEIYYRIACIYFAEGNYGDAMRTAEYAKAIYPDNVRAALLTDKIQKN